MKIFFENKEPFNEASVRNKITSNEFAMNYLEGVAKQLLTWSYSEVENTVKYFLDGIAIDNSIVENIGRIVGIPDRGYVEVVFDLNGTYDDNKEYIDGLMNEMDYKIRYYLYNGEVIFDFLDGDKSSLLVRFLFNRMPTESDIVERLIKLCNEIAVSPIK